MDSVIMSTEAEGFITALRMIGIIHCHICSLIAEAVVTDSLLFFPKKGLT